MSKLLAIDYGLKRTGIAATDDFQIIASGLCSISTKDIFKWLDEYMKKNEVEKIIVGLPKDLQNNNTDITETILATIPKIQRKFPNTPVLTIDERFTSKIAKISLYQSGLSKRKRRDKGLIDEVSATIILQSYMSQQGL